MKYPDQDRFAFFHNYNFFMFLLFPILGKLAIVNPWFPMEGLDPSWMLGLAVVSSQHLTFGKDIIYTFGPLSTVETGVWTQNSHVLSVMLSFAVAVSLCFFVYKLFQKASYLVKFLLVIFFFVNINSMPDFYFSLLPSVAALVLLDSYSASRHYAVCVSAFGFTAALLLLIKLSFGMGAFIDLFLLSSFYVIKKDRRSFFILIASFFLSFVVLYIASGQKLSDIIYYPVNMYYGVAGYNDAMSAKYDSSRPVINSAVFLILFLGYIAIRSLKPFNLKGIFSLLIFALLFLIVFKHSYVRNDSGHHADMYLLMCFMLIYILHALEKSTVKNILITVCVLSLLFLGSKEYWYFFNGTQVKNAIETMVGKARSPDRLFSEDKNVKSYERGLRNISNANPLPLLKGTSDIYDFNQAILIASGNKWNPRPAFQSYQAVTPYLAKANYDHLANSNTAPDNIFFKMEVIDERYPSMNDGLSWVALLGMYKPVGWSKNRDYLILSRDESPKSLSVRNVTNAEAKVGQEIFNPYENGMVFFKLHHLRKSILGSLISVVYKTDPVQIVVKLQNGQEKSFRIIPSMSESGFLLSPLTESTLAFSSLYGAGYFADSRSGSRVKSIIINPEEKYQYSGSFNVTFEQLDYPDTSKAAIAGQISKSAFDFGKVSSDTSINSCVDSFDYQIADGRLSLALSGWAFKKNVDIQKSSFALLLVDQEQKSGFEIPLQTSNRKDVSDFINDGHNYSWCGFSATGLYNVPDLKRNKEYKLYLKLIINGTEYITTLDKVMTSEKKDVL